MSCIECGMHCCAKSHHHQQPFLILRFLLHAVNCGRFCFITISLWMQVWNELHSARWKYRTQKPPKICHLCTIAQLCLAVSSQLRHVSTIEKNLLNSNTSPTCPYNMVNFSSLAAEIGSLDQFVSLGHPQLISTSFASWQRCYTAL